LSSKKNSLSIRLNRNSKNRVKKNRGLKVKVASTFFVASAVHIERIPLFQKVFFSAALILK
jgi:hypothetical protein